MSGYRVIHLDLVSTNDFNPELTFTATKMRVISAYWEGAAVSASFDVKTNLYPYPIALVHSQGNVVTYSDITIPINYSGGNLSIYVTENDGTSNPPGILSLQVEFLP